MQLIHYSKTPLQKVHSIKPETGEYKTRGLWVSVKGEDDWLNWCQNENFALDRFACATEVVLHPDAEVEHLTGTNDIDRFTELYGEKHGSPYSRGLDWAAIRRKWHGLIIAPYCWSRRLTHHTFWYYGWDCASGVIWDAKAIKELRVLEPPKLKEVQRD